MSVTAIGFSTSQIIPANSLLRLTFAVPYYDPFGFFAGHMTALWSNLPPRAGLFPSTSANVFPGATTATIDARAHAARPGADIIAAVMQLTDNVVELRSVQLLSAADVAVANTDAGAAARDAAAKKVADEAKDDSWINKILAGLSVGASTVKWVAIAVVLVVLLLAYRKVET